MTKYYGAFVGTPIQATPPHQVDNAYKNVVEQVLVRDTINFSGSAADTVQLAKLGWETVLDPFGCSFACDDLGTGGTISIGDVTYPAALAATVNTDSAALGQTSMLSAVAITAYGQPLWKMLGYATLAAAKAIGTQCELLLTRNSASGSGNIYWQMKGSQRI